MPLPFAPVNGQKLFAWKWNAGGTCLNWGRIPSKAPLKSAEAYQAALHADKLGISCGEVTSFRKGRVVKARIRSNGRRDRIPVQETSRLRMGRNGSCRRIRDTEGEFKGTYLKAEKIMIATGCKPRKVDEVEVDGKRVMTSREALAMTEQPQSIAIMGAGAIGAEFAYFLNAFGTKVTLIEMLPSILPVEDAEVSKAIEKSFSEQGIDCRTDTRVDAIEVGTDSVSLTLARGEETETLEAESLLLAIGVVPNLDGCSFGQAQARTEPRIPEGG